METVTERLDALDLALAGAPRITRDDLSIALERAGAAYGAYELSARRTRAIWRWFTYGGPILVVAVAVLGWMHFQDVRINDSLEHRMTAMSAMQEPVAPALDRLASQVQVLQGPPQVVVTLPDPAAPSATVPPSASAENGDTPPPAPADAVSPTPTQAISTAAEPVAPPTVAAAPANPTATCLLNVLCIGDLSLNNLLTGR